MMNWVSVTRVEELARPFVIWSSQRMNQLQEQAGDFAGRVQVLVNRFGGAAQLARRAGLSRQMIEKYAGGSEPNRENLVRLAEAADVSLEWLAIGRDATEVAGAGLRKGYLALPRYSVRAAAGSGEELVDWIYFEQEWLRRTLGVNPRELVIIEAIGDSMFPTIASGDLLLVDVSEPKLRGEAMYVLAFDDAVVVKRVMMPGKGRLILTSDNERYGSTEIARDELDRVRVVGRVVWAGGRI